MRINNEFVQNFFGIKKEVRADEIVSDMVALQLQMGYISPEEWRKMPIPTFIIIGQEMTKINNEVKKEHEKIKAKMPKIRRR
jgi:hypothetical protein